MGNLIDHLRRVMLAGREADLTDGQLLEHYLSDRDETAVAALVRRHGPMVWGVCRRVLPNHHDAEDAFQATFLVLVRRAASIMPREMVGNWLYGVAHQTALKARATTAKRQARERQVKEMPEPAARPEPDLWPNLEPLLDQELSRLPDKYRVAMVLCDLEGQTRKEVARRLKIPEGTLSSRLTTARAMLAKRLARHGLAVSGGALAAAFSQQVAAAGVPSSAVSTTIKAATFVTAGKASATGPISVKVAALTEGVLKTMLFTKLKLVMVVLAVAMLGMVAFAGGLYMHETAQQGPPDKPLAVGEKNDRDEEAVADGKVVGGLRIQLQLHGPKKGDKLPSHCVVVMENVGDSDLNVQLGYSLANGKSYHPAALRLLVSLEGNKTRTLTYSEVRVAGRLDPFVVPLPAGSSYSLRCPLDKFVDSKTGDGIDLTAKEYRIAAELVGQPVSKASPDLQGFTLMPYWQGTARSNEVKALPR
jgi:RNA polymerase sigma factor (sigma-70 family)